MQGPPTIDIFIHVRIVMGIVIGLGMARLLTGLAYFVQHPGKREVSLIHLVWAASLLLTLVHFWWWEFRLSTLSVWTFQIYIFLTTYAVLLFLLCTLLFPDEFDEYAGYEEFFIGRRRWFFGVLGLSYMFDFVDTVLKGWEHLQSLGLEYKVGLFSETALCLVALATSNRRFHLIFAGGAFAYQILEIAKLFGTTETSG
jgi:hypothetical protein